MFLSKLVLNPRNSLVRRDLASTYEMHRTLLNGGFGGVPRSDIGRVLFRVDHDRFGGSPLVLVQSETTPDWNTLPDNYLVAAAESKPFDLLVAKDQKLRFRLRANPTKRVATNNPRLGSVMVGKRIALVTEGDQLRWLFRKGADGGFRVPGEWVSSRDSTIRAQAWERDFAAGDWYPNFRVDVIPEGRDRNGKTGHRDGAFVAVRFEGVLCVTDPLLFVKTIHDGVGSAKGFGFGLLSVAPGG